MPIDESAVDVCQYRGWHCARPALWRFAHARSRSAAFDVPLDGHRSESVRAFPGPKGIA
jgi:hypothetical protein